MKRNGLIDVFWLGLYLSIISLGVFVCTMFP